MPQRQLATWMHSFEVTISKQFCKVALNPCQWLGAQTDLDSSDVRGLAGHGGLGGGPGSCSGASPGSSAVCGSGSMRRVNAIVTS